MEGQHFFGIIILEEKHQFDFICFHDSAKKCIQEFDLKKEINEIGIVEVYGTTKVMCEVFLDQIVASKQNNEH